MPSSGPTISAGWSPATIGGEAGPIRLTERAAAHIEERRGQLEQLAGHGYANAADFVQKVAAGFGEIWTARRNDSRMLVMRTGADKERAQLVYVLLQPATDGHAWEVQSGGVFRAAYPAGAERKLLWRGERANIVPTGTDSQMSPRHPQITRPELETTHSAESQSDAEIGRAEPTRNDGVAGKETAAPLEPDQPNLFGDEPRSDASAHADESARQAGGAVPPELARQIDSLSRDFADDLAADRLNPETEAELASIAEADAAAQSVLGAIQQAASCLLGGLG